MTKGTPLAENHKNMNIDQLVAIITAEVVRQLRTGRAQEHTLILGHRAAASVDRLVDYLGPDASLCFSDKDGDDWAGRRIILPCLSCHMMANLATGRASEPVERKILATLLAGRTIEVFEFEYERYRHSAPQQLFRLYESYAGILKTFGLLPVVSKRLDTVRLEQMLITEKDVLAVHKQGGVVLEIPGKALLTPLAVDCAKERKIKINFLERRTS
jgi:ethanolamine utilization protein